MVLLSHVKFATNSIKPSLLVALLKSIRLSIAIRIGIPCGLPVGIPRGQGWTDFCGGCGWRGEWENGKQTEKFSSELFVVQFICDLRKGLGDLSFSGPGACLELLMPFSEFRLKLSWSVDFQEGAR